MKHRIVSGLVLVPRHSYGFRPQIVLTTTGRTTPAYPSLQEVEKEV